MIHLVLNAPNPRSGVDDQIGLAGRDQPRDCSTVPQIDFPTRERDQFIVGTAGPPCRCYLAPQHPGSAGEERTNHYGTVTTEST